MDDSFKEGVIKSLNDIMSCFKLKSTLNKSRVETFWFEYQKVLFRHPKYKPQTFTVSVYASIHPFDWRSNATLKFSQGTTLIFDLTEENREELIELCQKLALTSTNIKINCALGYENLFTRFSKLKPAQIMI